MKTIRELEQISLLLKNTNERIEEKETVRLFPIENCTTSRGRNAGQADITGVRAAELP